MENYYQEKVEFTKEGFEKAVKSLDFLNPEQARAIASAFAQNAMKL